jgi:hypothetical protein
MVAWLVPLGLATGWLGSAAAAVFHHQRNENLSRPEIQVNIDFGPRVRPCRVRVELEAETLG